MLSDEQKAALERWYAQDHVLEEAKRRFDRRRYEDLEEFLHMRCLVPLSRHDELPEFMKDEAGVPLLPTNCDPRVDEEVWQDTIDVGWAVLEAKLGIARDEVHRLIGKQQRDDWEAFLESVERRMKERGEA